MQINVTQEDLDLGEPGQRCSCPIALAVTRATGKTPEVLYTWLEIGDREYKLPPEARAFISAYDGHEDANKDDAKPFTFDLPI